MSLRLVEKYQASWRTTNETGTILLVYRGGQSGWMRGLSANDFQNFIDLLRNESPIYGDHVAKIVSTAGDEAVGEGENRP